MRAYELFLDYVKVHTTSNDESGTHPSFNGEFALASKLTDKLNELGLKQVKVDDKCYVYGLLPATAGYENVPALGFISHMDTSNEASGENVTPVIYNNYDGRDLKLKDGKVMSTRVFPFLRELAGETLITSDGTTLLGADDKAGIAEIITAVSELIESNEPHGDIWIGFTPDEEIGEGADFFDLDYFKADFAYTVDGGDVNCIEYENFNAASAVITVSGVSVHPGSAKDAMINSQIVAMEFHSLLPVNERPEHTEDREGFYHLTDMKGRVSETVLSYIIRDHDREKFEERKRVVAQAAETINEKYGAELVKADIKDSYYNMLEKIKPHMHLIENARKAIAANGMEPIDVPIRGGTDGARLSFEGLPCPNLGTGGFNFHGCFECITVERMDKSVAVIKDIIRLYAQQ